MKIKLSRQATRAKEDQVTYDATTMVKTMRSVKIKSYANELVFVARHPTKSKNGPWYLSSGFKGMISLL